MNERFVVVSFDGTVTEPCAYRIVVDFKEMGRQEVVQMAKSVEEGQQVEIVRMKQLLTERGAQPLASLLE